MSYNISKIHIVLAALIILSVSLLMLYSISNNNYFISAVVILLLIVIVSWNYLENAILILVMLFFSSSKLPSFSNVFSIFYALLIVLLPFLLFRYIAQRIKSHRQYTNIPLYLLLLLLLIIISVRGIGIKSFGGESIGGFAYFQIFAVVFLYLYLKGLAFDSRQWKKAFLGMCALAAIPLIAEILVFLGFVRVDNEMLRFLSIRSVEDFLQGNTYYYGSRVRIFSASQFSIIFLIAYLIANEKTIIQRGIRPLIIGFIGSIILAGFSGHRIGIISIIIFIILFLKINTPNTVTKMKSILLIVLFIMLIVVIAPELPFSFQRAIAWIPNINVSQDAVSDTSNEWRLWVWQLAIKYELPKYWLIGKGLSFNPNVPINVIEDTNYTWALESNNYHNGPLSTLINLGVPGFVLFISFIILSLKRNIVHLRFQWHNSYLALYHRIFYCFYVMYIVEYFFIFGETTLSITTIVFVAFILETLISSENNYAQRLIAYPNYLYNVEGMIHG